MSRYFDGSTEYLENTSLALSFPLTMACWFWCDTGSTFPSTLMNMGGDSSLHFHQLTLTDVRHCQAVSRAGGGAGTAASGVGAWSFDTWNHACAVFAAADDRRVFINSSKFTNSDSISPTINQFNIGVRFYNATYSSYNDGRIAHAAVWNKALTDQQAANLAGGQSPLEIEYSNLQGYWEILGDFSPEPDWSGNGYNMTLGGTPNQAPHVSARQIFPYRISMLDEITVSIDEKLPDKIKIVQSNQIPIPQLQL